MQSTFPDIFPVRGLQACSQWLTMHDVLSRQSSPHRANICTRLGFPKNLMRIFRVFQLAVASCPNVFLVSSSPPNSDGMVASVLPYPATGILARRSPTAHGGLFVIDVTEQKFRPAVEYHGVRQRKSNEYEFTDRMGYGFIVVPSRKYATTQSFLKLAF